MLSYKFVYKLVNSENKSSLDNIKTFSAITNSSSFALNKKNLYFFCAQQAFKI